MQSSCLTLCFAFWPLPTATLAGRVAFTCFQPVAVPLPDQVAGQPAAVYAGGAAACRAVREALRKALSPFAEGDSLQPPLGEGDLQLFRLAENEYADLGQLIKFDVPCERDAAAWRAAPYYYANGNAVQLVGVLSPELAACFVDGGADLREPAVLPSAAPELVAGAPAAPSPR